MAAPAPHIAVVIATRGRETRLAFALEALAEQTLDRDRFEVIVVRDSDAGGPLAAPPDGLQARFLTRPGIAGPAPKRNHGWRAAEAALVAFTDDDCRPAPDWLERLVEASDGDGTFLQGRTEPDPDERHLLHGFARSMEVIGPSEWHETCNMAYPRELLAHLGGFDESLEHVGDDTDLGMRARKAGARRAYVDRALVRHAVLPRPFPRALRDGARWAEMPRVIARHPELRDALYHRFFMRDTHAKLPLAIAGAIAFRHRPLLAGAALFPYLNRYVDWPRLRPSGLLRLAAHVPARVAVDATEIATAVRSALKHRVLVI